MLKWRVIELMAEYQVLSGNKLTQQEIAERTGLARTTVAKMVSGRGVRVDLASLDVLLNFFSPLLGREVDPGELFQYTYDGKYDLVVPLPR